MAADAARWAQVKTVFDRAAELPPAAREALIASAALDAGAQAELRSLLAHHDQASAGSAFLAGSAAQALAEQSLPAAHAAQAGQRLGAWQIVRAVGAGGMGEVFEARRADGSYEGRAAIKLLKRGMDSTAVLQRFAQERQALARLAHPHIARLLDAGASDDGLPYFVMEFVDGQPIDAAVRGLPLERRLVLFLQLADAVAHAHRNLLVHRDLKPGNVLVDAESQVKLLDFGIAKALDPLESHDGAATLGGQRPYTPHHASPEQVRGEPVSTATDIYSLGVLLYQLLTGTRPTGRHATTAAEAARCVLDDEPTRPSRLSAAEARDPQWLNTRKKLEGDLDNILLKALEKAPERRYASVDALAADVQAYLAGWPVSARPASPAYVLGKFVRRNRWAVLAGGLGGLGLASGLAAALLQERPAAALGALGLAGGLAMALFQARSAAVSRNLAQQRLAETRAIVSDVMERHADAVHYLPGGATLKAELLQNMLGHLDRLAAQARGDAAFAGQLAMACARLAHLQGDGLLLAMQGQADADANALRALPLFEAGATAHAGNPWYAIWWARAHRARADAARRRGEVHQALAAMQAMADTVQRALERHPGQADLLAELGSAHFGRAQLFNTASLAHLGDAEAALTALAEAEAVYQQLVASGKASAEDLHQLGSIAGARMLVVSNLGRDAEAVAHGERAVRLRRENLARDPQHVAYRNGLATELNNLAAICLLADEPARALEHITHAQAVLAALAHDDADPERWRKTGLRLGLHGARALRHLGRAAEAVPLLHALLGADWLATEAAGPRRRAWAATELALALQQLGRRDEAQQQALTACAAWQAVLAGQHGDAEGWLLLAQTQHLLHDLGLPPPAGGWPAAHAASVARARAAGPLLPRHERQARWD